MIFNETINFGSELKLNVSINQTINEYAKRYFQKKDSASKCILMKIHLFFKEIGT